jgi:hypothetical protein
MKISLVKDNQAEMNMKSGIMAIVAVIVMLIVFGALLPLVTETIDTVNADGTIGTLLDNIPLFLTLGVVLTIIIGALVYIKGSD